MQISRLVLTFFELIEAEGRNLRHQVARTVMLAAWILVAGLLLAAGLGFLVWVLFHGLSIQVGTGWAALIVGLICVVIAGGMMCICRRIAR